MKKVKVKKNFMLEYQQPKTLGLTNKEYADLVAGKTVEINLKTYKNRQDFFILETR